MEKNEMTNAPTTYKTTGTGLIKLVNLSLLAANEDLLQAREYLAQAGLLVSDLEKLRGDYAEMANENEGLKVEIHGLRNRLAVAEGKVEGCQDWIDEQIGSVNGALGSDLDNLREVLGVSNG